MSTRQYLEIKDEAFGKLDIYGEWSENETVEAEGFCKNSSVLPHTDKKKIFQEYRRRRLKLKLLRDANKEFVNDDNVKKLFEQYKGFFKETVLLEETKAQEAFIKTKPAAPKEPAEKAHEAPQNVKPKPTAVKKKEAAEKPKPTENVKEVAEKPKEPAEKAHEVPQYVKPKPVAVKTKEAAEKPMPAENVKELAEKPKEPAGDDYQVVPAATVIKAEDRKEFEVETFTQWIERNIDWVGEPTPLHSQPALAFQPPPLSLQLLALALHIEALPVPSQPAPLAFQPPPLHSQSALAFQPPPFSSQLLALALRFEALPVPSQPVPLAFQPTPFTFSTGFGFSAASFAFTAAGFVFINASCAFVSSSKIRMRYKIATNIMLHQFNAVSNKMFDFAFTFETKYTEQARVSMIVDVIKNKNNHDPPKQVKETESANVVIGVNEVVDQVKEKRHQKK
nr:peptidase C48, SUMO/sentrin/Ubl1 [Tanacetum cinerariifolium]